MIKTRTLFILGAGASHPYGLPTGDELKKKICGAEGERELFAPLMEFCNLQRPELVKFQESFRLSGRLTIDRFLGHRPDLAPLGKLFIASALCQLERPETVFNPRYDDDWYCAVWHEMVSDDVTPENLEHNQIRFVTFNYDRSLEYFFFKAIGNTFPSLSDDQALDHLEKIPILHVYGGLGDFHCRRGDNVRVYEPRPLDGSVLPTAADAIKIIPDDRKDSREFEEAREWIIWSNRIFFLGFGFDRLNDQRLNVAGVLAEFPKQRHIVASVCGKQPPEIKSISDMIWPGQNLWSLDHKNLMTLRNSSRLSQ